MDVWLTADKSLINLCHNKIFLWSLGQCHQVVQRQVVISIKGKDFLVSAASTHNALTAPLLASMVLGKHLLNNMEPENWTCASGNYFVLQRKRPNKLQSLSPIRCVNCCRLVHWQRELKKQNTHNSKPVRIYFILSQNIYNHGKKEKKKKQMDMFISTT